ncbi:MAG: ROK family protein, partial [Jatrophihabitans sp.]|uniref:ROK family protein n=1 Tax=Jatrophihabitans sp. TaxID=1932789 RepID=UPI003F81AC0F
AATRSDIARLPGLSRPAATARRAAVLEAGVGRDPDEAPSRVGRPAARLEFDAGAGVVFAAALGRSRTQLAVCDLAGEVLASDEFDQEIGLHPDQLLPTVVRALRRLLVRSGHRLDAVRGIGLSIPGTVDPARRCSHESPIMPGWNGIALDGYFRSLTDAPVHLDSDTNAIALAERSGHLAGHPDALILKASSGIGVAVISGGRLHHGADGAAGEIGHVRYAPAARLDCRCGETGCLEAIAAGWALVQTMREAGADVAHIRDVVALAVTGDSTARRLIRSSGRHIGTVLAAAVTLLNPAVIVIGGDMVPAYDLFVAGLRESVFREANAVAARNLQIVPATHADQAGVRGCAELVLDHVLSIEAVDAAFAG